MDCDNCNGMHGVRRDEDTVLCDDCVEAIKNHNDRVETEQDAMRARY